MRASIFLLIASLFFAPFAQASQPLVVHEWGTFTSLQDEQGRSIGGLNTDDEPLPAFVHDLLAGRTSASPFAKGLPGGNQSSVTMRLETPVVYFHLPEGAAPRKIDLSVEFRGGLLSQFYPDAKTNIAKTRVFPIITEKTVGTLEWTDVQLGTNAPGPKTDSHVWLAPRKVDAADVTASNGESERYLFYRGVGHLDAPIVSTQTLGQLTLSGRDGFKSRKVWLARFGANGLCQAIEWNDLGSAKVNLELSLEKNGAPVLGLSQLRASMRQALIADGLFDDEADAMLNTWEKSYFRTPGLRLFYLVPREWTDRILPLKLSVDAKIERVMVGRLEIVSPEQRIALHQLSTIDNISKELTRSWHLYRSLGRFRNALVRDEQRVRSTTGLRQFVNLYGL